MPKTDEELIQLAKDIWAGHVFTSVQCNEPHLLQMIFLPLTFMSQAQLQQLKDDDVTLFYGHLSDASDRAVNGYPILFKMGMLTRTEQERLAKYIEQVQQTMAEIK